MGGYTRIKTEREGSFEGRVDAPINWLGPQININKLSGSLFTKDFAYNTFLGLFTVVIKVLWAIN